MILKLNLDKFRGLNSHVLAHLYTRKIPLGPGPLYGNLFFIGNERNGWYQKQQIFL